MNSNVIAAFSKKIVTLPIGSICQLKKLSIDIKKSLRYRRIEKSIVEVGIIEPLIVSKTNMDEDKYLLLDGHLRLSVLTGLDILEVRCLIATDDEAYTYNKRVSGLSTVQEHFMLVQALERGVSEERLSRALNIDVRGIRRKRTMLDGICDEVIRALADKSVSPLTFETLRAMNPRRQTEAAELMDLAQNYTVTYAKALLAATSQADLTRSNKPKKMKGLTTEQMARMESEMSTLQQDFKSVEASLGDSVLQLVIASGYLSRLTNNKDVRDYLTITQPEILRGFEEIAAASSLSNVQSLEAI